MIKVEEYAPWITTDNLGGFDTKHLPTKVVKQPFLFCIDSRTDYENPRLGGCWFSLNMDGKMNQPLSGDEKLYILKLIEHCLDELPGKPLEEVETNG